MGGFNRTVCGIIFGLSFVAVVPSSCDTGGCEVHPWVGNFRLFALVYLTQAQELLDSDNLWPFLLCYTVTFMGRQCAKFRSTANCVGLWRTVHFLYPATTYAHCHVPWYKSVIQLGFSLYSIHNLVPVALNSVYPVETFTMLYNLYIVTHPSSSQPFLCTVLWTNIFFALAQSMWRLQKWTLRRNNFSAQ